MKGTTTFPTLGRAIGWTAIFYVFFGLILSGLAWSVGPTSAGFLLRMLSLNVPGWAAGWVMLLIAVPFFGMIGAISGVIMYWPLKAAIQYLSTSNKMAS